MKKEHFYKILGAILFLTVAMGIGRFSFTPILPYMKEAEGFSVGIGSWIAAGNYIGYLIGALSAGFIVKNQKSILIISAWLCFASVILMAFSHSFASWFSLRILGGVTGGFLFVLTSSMIMDYLAKHQLSKWSGYIFSGIGLGIAISGLVVPFFISFSTWRSAYIGLAIIAGICILMTMYLWRNLTAEKHIVIHKKENVMKGFMFWLAIAYGFEGLGYIITGTFLVDLIHEIPSLQQYAAFSWVIVGIGAIPSAPLWTWLMSTYKPIHVIRIAYLLQVIGIILPVISSNIWTVLLSALLFGSTFVGLVSMTTGYGRQLFPQKSVSVVSLLTTFYAVGQIIGPIIAGMLITYYKTYNAALIFATAIILVAVICLQFGHRKYVND